MCVISSPDWAACVALLPTVLRGMALASQHQACGQSHGYLGQWPWLSCLFRKGNENINMFQKPPYRLLLTPHCSQFGQTATENYQGNSKRKCVPELNRTSHGCLSPVLLLLLFVGLGPLLFQSKLEFS